jgi:hypothetical protein
MKKEKDTKIRNWVHKASQELNKPKTHRDRTKEYKNRTLKYEDYGHDHPMHKPYKREKIEDEGSYEEEWYEELPDPSEWYTDVEEGEEEPATTSGMEPPELEEDDEIPPGEREEF